MSLATLRKRIDSLLTQRQSLDKWPSAVLVLPERGARDIAGTYPRISRTGSAAVVIYRREDGQPTDEELRRLIESARGSARS